MHHHHDEKPLYEGMPEGLPRDYGHFSATALEDDLPLSPAGFAALGALILVCILACAPILAQPGDLHLPRSCEPYDAAIYPWNFFWFAESWGADDGSPLFTRRFYWPEGESLALYTPTYAYGLMALPFLWFFGAAGAFVAVAFLLVFSTLATALLSYRLARSLGQNEAGALAAALLFTFAAGRWMNAARLNLFSTEFLLLYLLVLLGFLRRGGLWRGLTLAVAASALLLQSQPLFFQAGLATMLILAVAGALWALKKLFWKKAPHWTLHGPEHVHPPKWWQLAACAAAFVLLAGPFLWEMARALDAGGPALQQWRNLVDLPHSSLDLAALVHPSVDDRGWASILGDAARERSFFEGQAAGSSVSFFLGAPWLLLLVLAVARVSWRRWLPVLLATLGAFWLALGPTVRLGGEATALPAAYDLLSWFPPVRLGKSPVRWVLLVQLGLALVAGYGADVLLRPRPDLPRIARSRMVALVLLLAGALFEASETLPLRSVEPSRRVPDEVYALADEEGAVLDLPYGAHRVTATAMALGAAHRRPIFFGLYPRARQQNLEVHGERRLFQDLRAIERWARLRPVVQLDCDALDAEASLQAAQRLRALDPRVEQVTVQLEDARLIVRLAPEVLPADATQAAGHFAAALAGVCDISSHTLELQACPGEAPTAADPAAAREDLRALEVGEIIVHDLHDEPAHRRALAAALRAYVESLGPDEVVSCRLGEGYELSILSF